MLHDKAIRDVLDLKVFVQVRLLCCSTSLPLLISLCWMLQCDSDLMLARRLRRDLVERGRDAAGVLDQFVPFSPSHYSANPAFHTDTSASSNPPSTTTSNLPRATPISSFPAKATKSPST